MKRFTLRAGLALALLPALALAQTAIPEPDAGDLGTSFLSAIATKNWVLLAVVVLAAGVLIARLLAKRFAGKFGAWIASPRGSAILASVGGTATLLMYAIRNGVPFTLDLLLGCFMTALSASGLWSVGKAVVEKPKPQPMAPEKCTPIQIANGTCSP